MYLFFDTETSGLPKLYHAPATDIANWPRMVQIAWAIYDEEGNKKSKIQAIIRPEGFEIPPQASKVHGITTEIALQKGRSLEEVLDEFVIALREADYLVAHNIKFDENIVAAEMIRKNFNHQVMNKNKICTMSSATDYCRLPGPYGYKWPNLTELHQILFGTGF
jgi:DNA polymerase III subunit epsilon